MKINFLLYKEIWKKLRMPAKKNASGGDGGAAAAAKPKETKGGTSIKVNLNLIVKLFLIYLNGTVKRYVIFYVKNNRNV